MSATEHPPFTEAFPVATGAAESGAQKPDEPHTLSLTSLGGYKLQDPIGQGGMGIVYKAEDPRLSRFVAIKVMKPEFAASEEMRRRFLREARLQAQVESDYVVQVFAADEFAGTPYLVMPLLRGQTLSNRLKQGRLALAEAVRIARETASGVAAAHRMHLIHRDIKPANIWLEESGRAKLMDFGLVRNLADDGERTHSGNVLGTPMYMAPEQSRGEEIDMKADLFSLGCVLYELTTGLRPFTGAQVAEILDQVREADPPEIRSLNPLIPTSLERLILQLLAKDPQSRPESAVVVAERLNELQSQIDASPVGGAPATSRRRHPTTVLALGFGATIMVVGMVWVVLSKTEQSRSLQSNPTPTQTTANVPADVGDDWALSFQRLSRREQRGALRTELKRRNPNFNGSFEFDMWDNDQYVKVKVNSHGLTDLTPFRAVPGLTALECMGDFHDWGNLESLEPIRGLQLYQAGFSSNPIRDISPFAGMPIRSLWIGNTNVEDFSPIYSMPLVVLHASSRSPIARIDAARLVGKPLTDVWIEPEQTDNFESLRLISTLKLIHNEPVAEFWKNYDAKKSRQAPP